MFIKLGRHVNHDQWMNIDFQVQRSKSPWDNLKIACEHETGQMFGCNLVKFNATVAYDERIFRVKGQGHYEEITL